MPCSAIVLPDQACAECGSKLTRIATKVTDREFNDAVSRGYDPDPAQWMYLNQREAEHAKRMGVYPNMVKDENA